VKFTLNEVIQQFDPDNIEKNLYLSAWIRNYSRVWINDWIPVYGFRGASSQLQTFLTATSNEEKCVREIAIKSLQEWYGDN